MPDIIDWEADKLATFSTQPTRLRHSLATSPLFSDAALANLIERSARENYYVNTMDLTRQDRRTRREGEIRNLPGEKVLQTVANGAIWIMLLNPHEIDPAYGELVNSIYAELQRKVPGFRPMTKKLSILISSPGVQVYYHCDVPGQTLWQVRGNKKVYVYPNREPYLSQPALEKIVLNESHEISLPYDPNFDNDATVMDIGPGEMLHWPLNSPHRVSNGNCVNVSFTTEHFTPEIKRAFVVNYANGVLRRTLGWQSLSQDINGANYWAKLGVAGLYKLSGRQKERRQKFKVDFAVDPSMPGGVRTIPAYEFQK